MYKVTLKINGMACGMCEAHVNDVIRKNVTGATKVMSSHKKGESSFLCERKPDEDLLKKAISETGYEVTGIGYETYEKKRGLFR